MSVSLQTAEQKTTSRHTGERWTEVFEACRKPLSVEIRFRNGALEGLRLNFADTAASPRTSAAPMPPEVKELFVQLREYFANGSIPLSLSGLPLAPKFTPFQDAVYAALRAIPAGETRSYAQLATSVGRPGAARAVGSAMANNPFPLFNPCHRVVRADGIFGNFTPDPRIKPLLLQHEGAKLP